MSKRGLFGSTRPYDTPLNPAQAAAYQTWRGNLPSDLQNDGDYDLQGAFLGSAQTDGRLHMTDQWKKPNHMTFSDGSQYSTPQTPGGHWVDAGIPNPEQPGQNKWVFWASPTNIQQHSLPDLARYFDEAEKGSAFVAPLNYRLPQR